MLAQVRNSVLPVQLAALPATPPAVADESFWEGLEPVHFGGLPRLQDSVTVIGWVGCVSALQSCFHCGLALWSGCTRPCVLPGPACHHLCPTSARLHLLTLLATTPPAATPSEETP